MLPTMAGADFAQLLVAGLEVQLPHQVIGEANSLTTACSQSAAVPLLPAAAAGDRPSSRYSPKKYS
jgi:hypothetical protein